jgi:hypothetical protein
VDPADWHPHIAKLRVGSILRGAVRLYRLEPARVAGASLAILLPPVLLGEAVHGLDATDASKPFLLVSVLPATASLLTLLGLVLLAGVMDELVGSAVRGTPQPSLAEAARALPLGRLVVADLVVAVLVSAAAALGAVPGVVLAALVGIAGPAVNIERLGPIRAVARSVRLTWPHVWIAVGVVAPALVVEGVAHAFLLRTWDALGFLGELLVEVPLIMSVGAMVALTEVVLAYALMARDPASPVAAMAESARAAAPAPAGQRGVSTTRAACADE